MKKYQGCMIGLAVGDALGWQVEFSSYPLIQATFGAEGVQDFRCRKPYEFTDDTQMSLATAWGLLDSERNQGIFPTKAVYKRYLEWLELQKTKSRAPGGTCLSALRSGKMGSIQHPINDSKGCGGVMRTAPVGLFHKDPLIAFWTGAQAAAVTHGHPSGYLPAGVLSAMTRHILDGDSIAVALTRATSRLKEYSFYEETLFALDKAFAFYTNKKDDVTNIHSLGGGWVGEEALAISVYCALRYPNSFEKAVCAAVNHNGDSDSTGSITGALLGASLGIEGVPRDWNENIEDRDVLLQTAKDLFDLGR